MTPEERAAFREFVRTHHPDRGGDPEVFMAGLARFSTRTEPPAPAARYDAPIEVVASLPVPVRVAVALIRTLRWHRHQRRVQ